jgi:hypothetical protein
MFISTVTERSIRQAVQISGLGREKQVLKLCHSCYFILVQLGCEPMPRTNTYTLFWVQLSNVPICESDVSR